jgi:hypothetical protein
VLVSGGSALYAFALPSAVPANESH